MNLVTFYILLQVLSVFFIYFCKKDFIKEGLIEVSRWTRKRELCLLPKRAGFESSYLKIIFRKFSLIILNSDVFIIYTCVFNLVILNCSKIQNLSLKKERTLPKTKFGYLKLNEKVSE